MLSSLLLCFQFLFSVTGNTLQVGDHIPWHKPLDGEDDSTSRIHHMLITEDTDLPQLETPYGNVEFRQVTTKDFMHLSYNFLGS